MLQVTSPAMKAPQLRLDRLQMGDAQIPAAGFTTAYQKCMHETVYYHSVFIRCAQYIVEEEWLDIHKWDRESRLQSHPVLFSVA